MMEGVDMMGAEQTVNALAGGEGAVFAVVQCLMFSSLGGNHGQTYWAFLDFGGGFAFVEQLSTQSSMP